MHCHLRLPLPPVVLGFNHEVRNAPACQITANSENPPLSYCDLTISNLNAVHHLGFKRKWISTIHWLPRTDKTTLTEFQHNWATCGCVIDDLTNFYAPFFTAGCAVLAKSGRLELGDNILWAL